MSTTSGHPESPSESRQRVMESASRIAGDTPSPQLRSLICPFCGSITPDTGRCKVCSARFDPLSRQATQNQMGPWCIRDEGSPFRPGCTYETLRRFIEQDVVGLDSVLRGPTTRQFWTLARHTPSIAHLLGVCHNCQCEVDRSSFQCPSCQASFAPERDRQHMGLGLSRPLPGQGNPEVLAVHAEPAGTRNDTASSASARAPVRASTHEESVDAIAQWRRAFDAERKRAWIAVVLAALVTVLALFYGILGVPAIL